MKGAAVAGHRRAVWQYPAQLLDDSRHLIWGVQQEALKLPCRCQGWIPEWRWQMPGSAGAAACCPPHLQHAHSGPVTKSNACRVLKCKIQTPGCGGCTACSSR